MNTIERGGLFGGSHIPPQVSNTFPPLPARHLFCRVLKRSITCPSPCAEDNPCCKGCSITLLTRLIGFKSNCLLRFHWAIRGQIWHPFLLSLSHFSADILEVLGEFQVVTCNLAVHSQGLLSADKAGISPGSADACSSKEPLKPLFNHLILLLVPLSISFFFGGGRKKQMQGNSVWTWISQIFWIPSKSATAPKHCS